MRWLALWTIEVLDFHKPMKTRNKLVPTAWALLMAVLFTSVSALLAETPPDSKMKPGLIVITACQGDVKITNATTPNGKVPAKGGIVTQGDTIDVGNNSSIALAFSNGSLYEVSANSQFVVQEYLQGEWAFSEEAWRQLTGEPTTSQTKVHLEFGDIVGNVKKLNARSSMQVSTPLGVAGIRGTSFKISARRSPNGSPLRASVSVIEGRVDFTRQSGGEAVQVTIGFTATVTVTPTELGQQIRISNIELTDITPEDRQQIEEIVKLIQQEVEVFIQKSVEAAAQTAGGNTVAPPLTGGINSTIPPVNIPTPTPTPAPTPTPTPAPSNL